MNKEFQDKLFKEYPKLFLHKHDQQKSLMGFGFEHADGWNHITEKLCKKLYDVILTLPELERNRYYITQIKEKFGKYECYMSKHTPELDKEIAIAQEIANKTCEVTGLNGELVELRSGWLKTLHPQFGKKAYEMYKENLYLKRDQKEYKKRVVDFVDSKIEEKLNTEFNDENLLDLLEIKVISDKPHKNIRVAEEVRKKYADFMKDNSTRELDSYTLFKEFQRELDKDI